MDLVLGIRPVLARACDGAGGARNAQSWRQRPMRYVMSWVLITALTGLLAPATSAAGPERCAGSSAAPRGAPVGLVLSGGGAKGAWEAGAAAALVEAGLPIALVAGSSAGALNGAMIAAGRVERLDALWR